MNNKFTPHSSSIISTIRYGLLTLHRLARTAGGNAEMAALWFNYLYPRNSNRSTTLRGNDYMTQRSASIHTLYPNPATDQLHLEADIPTGPAVLRLTDLLSGKVALQADLPAGIKGLRQANLNVRGVAAGQYAATILVNGVPTTTQKVFINR